MLVLVVILSVIIASLVLYLLALWHQIRRVIRQVEIANQSGSSNAISVALFDMHLNRLVLELNKVVARMESLLVHRDRDERNFRQLVANISHDLRTPLSAITGYQQMLSATELTSRQNRLLDVSRRNTDELRTLISRLFEYSMLMDTHINVEWTRVDISTIVGEQLVSQSANLAKRQLTVDFDGSIPVYLTSDAQLLKRIAQNLVQNLLDHAAGPAWILITPGPEIVLEVSNPVEDPASVDPAKMTERFYIGDPSRPRSGGLGLSIVAMIAELLQGRIEAELDGDVLTIRLTLPAEPENALEGQS